MTAEERRRLKDPREHVLNGIAHDPQGDRLFVTGKCWPSLFQARPTRPQPCAAEPAALCSRACSPVQQSLQPCAAGSLQPFAPKPAVLRTTLPGIGAHGRQLIAWHFRVRLAAGRLGRGHAAPGGGAAEDGTAGADGCGEGGAEGGAEGGVTRTHTRLLFARSLEVSTAQPKGGAACGDVCRVCVSGE